MGSSDGRWCMALACLLLAGCPKAPCADVECGAGTCVINEGAPVCLCQPGFEAIERKCFPVTSCGAQRPATDGGCTDEPRWDCSSTTVSTSADPAEPNECPPQARTLLIDGSVIGAFGVANDLDWYFIPPDPKAVVKVTNAGSSMSLTIFDGDGFSNPVLLGEGEPFGVGPRGRFLVASASEVGPYQLSLERVGEDDRTGELADALSVTGEARLLGSHDFPRDLDVTQLKLAAGSSARVTVLDGSPVEILDAQGTLLATDSELRVWSDGSPLYLVMRAPSTLRMPARWELRISSRGADDAPDLPAFARVPQAGGNQVFERDDDIDIFRLQLQPARVYEAECSGEAFCEIALLEEVPRGMVPSSRRLRFRSPDRGDAFLRFTPISAGSWSWTLTDLGPDDHPDSELGAAVLPAGAPLHGRLELDGDIDVFALSYPVGTVLQFDTPADKFIVNASPVSRSLLVTKTPMPVEVAGARGPYDIAVSFMGTDPGGNSEKPVAVPLPADIYGGFEFPGDDDAFLFQGLAGHVYRATITPSSSLLISDLRGRVAYGTGTLHFVPSIDTTIKVNVSADQAFAYQLSISDVGVDDHPDTPSAPLATITPGTPVQGQFDWADDLDFVVANVVPGRFYEGRCTTPNCWVRGTTLDNSGSDYCVQATGTELMLAVSRAGSGNGFMPGPWSLEFQDRGADDHSESEAQATVVPFDSSTTALLSCRRDVDTFTFSAAPRQLTTLRASCDGCTVDIRSMAAQYVTALDGGLTATIGGSTSPIIVSFSTSQPTALSFTISDGGFDDYGNTLVTSTVVDAGTTISGELQFRGDVDAFAFDLAAGGHLFELVGPAVAAQLWRSSGYVTSLSTSDMQFVAPTAERYYLLLNGTGAYELIVQ